MLQLWTRGENLVTCLNVIFFSIVHFINNENPKCVQFTISKEKQGLGKMVSDGELLHSQFKSGSSLSSIIVSLIIFYFSAVLIKMIMINAPTYCKQTRLLFG